MSTFGTLNTAVSGLLAAQRAMDTTGQNVVNANTPGYSRQRVVLSSVGAPSSATFHTGNSVQVGGVRVEEVTRIRDAFVEATRAAAGGRQNALQAHNEALSSAQVLLAEPGANGMQAGLDSFYAAWHELSLNPDNSAAGSVVIQRGLAVTDELHALSGGLSTQWGTTYQRLTQTVDQANQAASDLAALNGQILEGQAAGRPVNELLDRRDTVVRTLSDLVGGYAVPEPDGQLSVAVNGITIVSGGLAQKLTVTGATDLNGAVADPPTIKWGPMTVSVESGAAAGQLAALRTDLPALSSSVNAVATSLRDAVNSLHTSGFTLAGTAGGPFFTGTGAADLTVAVSSPGELAMASASGVVDGAVALQIGDLANDVKAAAVLGGPGPSSRYRDLTTGLGTQVQSLQTAITVQSDVVNSADDAVNADSGVSLDEEMSSMLMFQRSYQASARVITTVDEMLDTLVNRTGQVGR